MHPIHKHMSGRMSARKADERYDAKEAYNKNLSGKARLHYLENDIHDKGMSMKAPMDMKTPMDMKSPMDMGHKSPADMKSPMKKGHESAMQEKKDLMKYNPIDDRAGSPAEMSKKQMKDIGRAVRTASGQATKKDERKNKRETRRTMRHVRKHGSGLILDNTKKKTSPVNMASPMYDKGHEGDQDGHVHPRTQGEVDVMNKHGNALNKFIGKVNKFGPMSESQRSRVQDKIKALEGQYYKTRDSIGNVHKQFDLKRDQEFEDLFGDGR